MNKYSHVIWDWNGTLFNDVQLCVEIINELLASRKMKQISVDYYKEIFTFPVKKYYEIAGFDFTKEDFSEVGKEWMDIYEERKLEARLFDDVLPTMSRLKSSGIKQYLLSAYSLQNLENMIERFELNRFVEKVKGLDNIYAESKLQLGLELLEELDLNGAKALLIGDTLHDYETAKAMNVDCALVARGHQAKNVLLKNAGVNVYDSLEELRKDLF